MQTILNKYDWDGIKIEDVFRVKSGNEGTKINDGCNTFVSQIGLKLSGYTEIFYNGKRYEFREGTVLYLPRERDKSIDYHKTIIKSGESLCLFFNSKKSLPPVPVLIDLGETRVEDVFWKLYKAYNKPSINRFELMSAFYDMLFVLDKILIEQKLPQDDALTEIAQYLKEHCIDEYIEFGVLAKKYEISIDYLRHSFKKRYGISPLSYVNNLKISRIKALICENKYSLSRIAQMSGFSSLNYFSRFFKKNTGLTATEYKRQIGLTAV